MSLTMSKDSWEPHKNANMVVKWEIKDDKYGQRPPRDDKNEWE